MKHATRNRFYVLWMALLAIALVTAPASAISIFVDNVGGSDLNNGHAPRSIGAGVGPCRTINHALKKAQKGDRVVLVDSGEPYREQVAVQAGRNSGWVGQPFVIDGQGAILDGTQPIAEDAWEHVKGDIFRFRPPRTSYQVLFLDNLPAERVDLTKEGKIRLEPRQWCMYKQHIYFKVEKDVHPVSYKPRYGALKVGLTIYDVQNVVVKNLIVQGYQLDGINAHDNSFKVTLDSVTSRGNGRSGITAAGASRVTLENCLVGDNYDSQLRIDGHSSVEVNQSEILDNTALPWKLAGGRLSVDGKPVTAERPRAKTEK